MKSIGISIHYKGRLNSEDLIDPFCDEVKDIADSMEWEYTIINHELKDEKILNEKLEFLNKAMDKLENILNFIHHEKYETAELIASKIERIIKTKLKGNDKNN